MNHLEMSGESPRAISRLRSIVVCDDYWAALALEIFGCLVLLAILWAFGGDYL